MVRTRLLNVLWNHSNHKTVEVQDYKNSDHNFVSTGILFTFIILFILCISYKRHLLHRNFYFIFHIKILVIIGLFTLL